MDRAHHRHRLARDGSGSDLFAKNEKRDRERRVAKRIIILIYQTSFKRPTFAITVQAIDLFSSYIKTLMHSRLSIKWENGATALA